MIREIIQTLACLSVLNGSTLSLHLTNDRSAEHSSSSGSPPMPNPGGMLQHHSNNPYRRMAAAAESERMLFMGGGRHGRPIITGRLHLTSGDPDGGGGGVGSDGGGDELNYQPSSLTMLQDNEFPIRREPFFFDEDDGGDGGGGVGGGGIGYGAYRHPSPDHYHHRYDDGSYEIMEDIFNRGEGIYRKFPPIHHQAAQYHEPAPRGLQELFEHHENVAAAADEISPNHRVDIRYKQKSQRKRTQQKQNPDKLSTNPDASSSGSGSSSSSSSGSVGKVEAASPAAAAASQPSSASAQEQQQNTNQQQQQQQLLHPNSNNKRSGIGSPPVTHSIASQLMLRSPRGQRQYDVPQIECPSAIDGMERFACPTPDRQGRYRCIDDHVLCDGFIDCPEGEDEDRRSCMFYKTTRAHLDVLADALLRWARGR